MGWQHLAAAAVGIQQELIDCYGSRDGGCSNGSCSGQQRSSFQQQACVQGRVAPSARCLVQFNGWEAQQLWVGLCWR
jgi:hypothetical protein